MSSDCGENDDDDDGGDAMCDDDDASSVEEHEFHFTDNKAASVGDVDHGDAYDMAHSHASYGDVE